MSSKSFLIVFAIPFLSSCATTPLPEDYTGLNTNQIVFYVRCQTRDAVNFAFGEYLALQGSNEYTIDFGRQLIARKATMEDLDLKRADSNAVFFLKKYSPAAIAYDFTFDLTEQNNLGAQVDFLDTFTHGTFSLGISALDDRQRQTTENFRISDTFGELTGKETYCSGPRRDTVNWAYPITGAIGMEGIVKTFVNLNEFEKLSAKDDKDRTPIYSHTLDFQTTISGGVGPKVSLSAIKHGWQIQDASATSLVSRKDDHKVVIALALKPDEEPTRKDLTSSILGGDAVATSLAFKLSSAERIAIAELANQNVKQLLGAISMRPMDR